MAALLDLVMVILGGLLGVTLAFILFGCFLLLRVDSPCDPNDPDDYCERRP